jgi:TetR/AcrR family transcriptional regulator, fatty acid metabolism regulator protein
MPERAVRRKPELRRAIRHYARTAYTEAILEAAERLFLRVGYHDAKMADLAQAAGVAVGTLYKYFASKEEVFASLAARSQERVFALLSESAAVADPGERLRAIVERLFAYVEERGALFAIYMQLNGMVDSQLRSMAGPDCGDSFGEFSSTLAAVFEAGARAGQFRDDIPPAVLATTFAGMMNATLFDWVRNERSYALGTRSRLLLDLFLEGARAR